MTWLTWLLIAVAAAVTGVKPKRMTGRVAKKSSNRTTRAAHVHSSTIMPTGPAPALKIGDPVRATDDAPANFADRTGVVSKLGPDVGLFYGQWLRKL